MDSTCRCIGLGAVRGRIRAAIGPCINQAAYEVGPEFEARFLEADGGFARFFRRPAPESRPHFDLPAFVESRLEAAGLGEIERQSPCTFANPGQFFSYRRTTKAGEPDYGRQISAIVLT